MHHPRLVGGLGAWAVLLILALLTLLILAFAPPAHAASLPVVWSAEYRASTNDAFNTVATAPGGVVYAAGYAKADASGRGGLGGAHLRVIADASAVSLSAAAQATIAPGSLVQTDGWNGYAGLDDAGYAHLPRQSALRRRHRSVATLVAHRALQLQALDA